MSATTLTTTPPTAEPEITQEAARAMLAALKEACGRLDELVRRVRGPNQDDVYAALAGYEAIAAATRGGES